jgi:hypothetical protein
VCHATPRRFRFRTAYLLVHPPLSISHKFAPSFHGSFVCRSQPSSSPSPTACPRNARPATAHLSTTRPGAGEGQRCEANPVTVIERHGHGRHRVQPRRPHHLHLRALVRDRPEFNPPCFIFLFFLPPLFPVSWCACATGRRCSSSRGLGSELERTPIGSSTLLCRLVIWLIARSDRCAESQEHHPA